LDEYKKDYPNLATYGGYPTYDELLAVTKQGRTTGGAPGDGQDTDGSNLIISAAKKNDSRPLYILVWGSITDVAQAVYDDPSIKSKIRVYSIGSWNTAQDEASRNYLYDNHSDLWWIENDFTFRGMYEGGTQTGDLGNTSFVAEHVKDHGALGDLFYSKKSDIKMGDTPSFLFMIAPLVGGVGNLDDPTVDSWGGKFKNTSHGSNYWTDINDNRSQDAASVNVWRVNYLRDWQERMDRCSTPNPDDENPTNIVSMGSADKYVQSVPIGSIGFQRVQGNASVVIRMQESGEKTLSFYTVDGKLLLRETRYFERGLNSIQTPEGKSGAQGSLYLLVE